jgi:hypothetical protein
MGKGSGTDKRQEEAIFRYDARMPSLDAEAQVIDRFIAKYRIALYWRDAREIVVTDLEDDVDRQRMMELKPKIIAELHRRATAKAFALYDRD